MVCWRGTCLGALQAATIVPRCPELLTSLDLASHGKAWNADAMAHETSKALACARPRQQMVTQAWDLVQPTDKLFCTSSILRSFLDLSCLWALCPCSWHPQTWMLGFACWRSSKDKHASPAQGVLAALPASGSQAFSYFGPCGVLSFPRLLLPVAA